MKNHGLTIVIPYYLGEEYIISNLDNIFHAYSTSKDTFKIEIIVIIDSVEDKEHIIDVLVDKYHMYEDYLRIVPNLSNIGVAESRNTGYNLAKYNWITFIDQDDNVENNYFKILIENLDESYSYILLNGYFSTKTKKIPIFYINPQITLKKFFTRNYIHTPGLVIFNKSKISNKKLFIAYDKENYGTDDWAAYLEIYMHNKNLKYKFIRNKIFSYNIHENNYSNNISESVKSSMTLLNCFKTKYGIISKELDKTIDDITFLSNYYDLKDHDIRSRLKFTLIMIKKNFDINKLFSFIHKKIIKMESLRN